MLKRRLPTTWPPSTRERLNFSVVKRRLKRSEEPLFDARSCLAAAHLESLAVCRPPAASSQQSSAAPQLTNHGAQDDKRAQHLAEHQLQALAVLPLASRHQRVCTLRRHEPLQCLVHIGRRRLPCLLHKLHCCRSWVPLELSGFPKRKNDETLVNVAGLFKKQENHPVSSSNSFPEPRCTKSPSRVILLFIFHCFQSLATPFFSLSTLLISRIQFVYQI